MGNLHSVENARKYIGADCFISDDKSELSRADALILPGVGAFPDAIDRLSKLDFPSFIKAETEKKPLLGICLGMQLLFEKSYEFGEFEGLGLIKGAVRPIADVIPADLKIPHIGWNGLHIKKENPIFRYVKENDCVYFVHSFYAADCEESVIATSEYGAELTAAVASGNVYGCQFHPEKSGAVGLSILKAFAEL